MKFSAKAKQFNLKHCTFDMGMFDFHVRCIVGDHKKSIDIVNWLYEDKVYIDDGDEPRGQTFYQPPFCPVIWLPEYPTTPRQLATLAHECCHAVTRLYSWAGIPLHDANDELFAHAVGYMVDQILTRLKK